MLSSWHDVPPEHHGMVLVHDVVAVHGIPPVEVPEAHEEPDLFVALQPHDVLPGHLVGRRRDAVAREDAELLEMDVDRVLPVAGVVLQDPDLGRALPRRRTDLVHVEELAVDRPGAVLPLEPPRPRRDHLPHVDRRQLAQPCRYAAAVRLGRVAVDVEPEELRGARLREDLPRRAAAGRLLEAVLEEDAVADTQVGEVDDDVDALGDTQPEAGAWQRLWQEVSVIRDLHEWLAVAEEELVEARRPAVQQTEAVFPPGDLEERLDLAVHHELVAEDTVEVEGVEEDLSVRIEDLVGEQQRDVELSTRESKGEGVRVVLVARVSLVEEQVEAGESLVDVPP